MQDLNALKGKSLAELREIAKVLGIGDVMLKKRELMEKIAEAAAAEAPASDNTPAQEPVSAEAAPAAAAEASQPPGVFSESVKANASVTSAQPQ